MRKIKFLLIMLSLIGSLLLLPRASFAAGSDNGAKNAGAKWGGLTNADIIGGTIGGVILVGGTIIVLATTSSSNSTPSHTTPSHH